MTKKPSPDCLSPALLEALRSAFVEAFPDDPEAAFMAWWRKCADVRLVPRIKPAKDKLDAKTFAVARSRCHGAGTAQPVVTPDADPNRQWCVWVPPGEHQPRAQSMRSAKLAK